jgi:4-hydroxybenzoate polyprenyltransferase
MKKLLAIAQLLRLPNVFTAMADIFMGFLISHGSLGPHREFLLLLLASSSIYLAGMVLNDWFDIEVDRRERPERPLPSGRIAASHALAAGLGLLAIGTASATIAGTTSRNVALMLVVSVLLYDGVLKNTVFGPAVMGLCRTLNVLLAMSTQQGAIWLFDSSQPHGWRFGTMVAAAIGLYIMGVTRFARREVSGAPTTVMASTTVGFNLGLLLLALAARSVSGVNTVMAPPDGPYWLMMDQAPRAVASAVRYYSAVGIWISVVAVTNTMVWRAVVSGQPKAIQLAVKTCILALIGLDAAVVAFVIGPVWSGIVLLLLVPTLLLGRWVYTT